MSFFKSISKVFSNPVRAIAAVSTFGATELLRKVPVIGMPLASLNEQVLSVGAQFVANKFIPSFGAVAPQPTQGADAMAFNLPGFLGNVSNAFGNSGSSYISNIGLATGIASQFFPQPSSRSLPSINPTAGGSMMMVSNNLPAIRSGTTLTKEIWDAGSKILGRLGIPVRPSASSFSSALKRTLSSIASLARRTPSGTIVSLLIGLGLTAMEANLLTVWHVQKKKRRRMNVCNSKALRRAGRRIKGFHKLCQHLDIKKTVHRAAPRYTAVRGGGKRVLQIEQA